LAQGLRLVVEPGIDITLRGGKLATTRRFDDQLAGAKKVRAMRTFDKYG
jgi:hypothetical protein